MRLYLLPPTFKGEPLFELTGKQYNYIVNVLRLKVGQKIMGRDSLGGLWDLEIKEITKTSAVLSATGTEQETQRTDTLPEDRPQCPIILYQCLPKGRKTDDIIRMATEAGVRAVVLVRSHNCVADFSGKEDSKLSRYDAIVKEAVQQSGSLVPTTVEGVLDLAEVASDLNKRAEALGKPALGLFLHQCKVKEDQSSLISELTSFKGVVGLLVGSEGGLTDDECRGLLDRGMKAVLLKTNILRCETASIYAIGAVQTILENTACV